MEQRHFARGVEEKKDHGDQTGTVVRTAIVAAGLLLVVFEAIVRVVVEGQRGDVDEELKEKIEKEGGVRLGAEQITDAMPRLQRVETDVLQQQLEGAVHQRPLNDVQEQSEGIDEREDLRDRPEHRRFAENADEGGEEEIQQTQPRIGIHGEAQRGRSDVRRHRTFARGDQRRRTGRPIEEKIKVCSPEIR